MAASNLPAHGLHLQYLALEEFWEDPKGATLLWMRDIACVGGDFGVRTALDEWFRQTLLSNTYIVMYPSSSSFSNRFDRKSYCPEAHPRLHTYVQLIGLYYWCISFCLIALFTVPHTVAWPRHYSRLAWHTWVLESYKYRWIWGSLQRWAEGLMFSVNWYTRIIVFVYINGVANGSREHLSITHRICIGFDAGGSDFRVRGVCHARGVEWYTRPTERYPPSLVISVDTSNMNNV